ncbi:hypothetical protein KY338_04855 [Candidatus Woesearchaeota archaeon]|nr:hypothetical protein [Candidatus Woesearchaeota archaeon]MBW3006234.1 hypothetical protein [Candidatus Woesearchaeota archaeon]
MKKSWWILLVLVLCPAVLACSDPMDGKTYTSDQEFCNKNYYLPDGIAIGADNLVIDCNNAVLRGDFKGTGILIENRKNIEVKNCNIVNYNNGFSLVNAEGSDIHDHNLLRNYVGIRLENSAKNHFYEIRDVSIQREIRSIFSTENHIKYTNKNLEGEFCRHNSCNERTEKEVPSFPLMTFYQATLEQILKEAIRQWISRDSHSQQ